MRRTRIISGIVAFMMATTPFAGVKGGASKTSAPTEGIKEITVSQDSNFKTIESARDFIRTLDKSKYEGIEVTVAAGEYVIESAITFTEEDSGTASCPITYKGEDGATVVGGIALTAADFSKSTGALTEYFPEDVRDEIVTVDLTKYGITAEMIEKAMESTHYLETIPFLSANGTRQTIAQYPNDWLHIDGAETFDSEWNLTNTDDNDATYQRVDYGATHAEEVQSWSEVLPVYVRARIYKLWCPDDSIVIKIDKENPTVDIIFNGGHEPDKGGILYFYNVPEALDMPGEYIIDKNALLYYYPTETFESDTFSLPLSEGLVRSEGADYLTFENLTFETCLDDGLTLYGDHITFRDCAVSSTQENGLYLCGDDLRVENCVVHDIGEDGIDVDCGDIATQQGIGAVITNCDVYDCSVTNAYGYCITAGGENLLIDHNDCHDSNFKGIHVAGTTNTVVEYNEVWNMMLLSDDVGAISGDSMDNANVVFRYNYVHDIGPAGEAAKMKEYNPDYSYMGSFAFYFDGGCSYMEVCNNVVVTCDTGYLSNGGRGNSCHNNVFMDCHEWYIWFSEIMFGSKVNSDGTLKEAGTSFPSYVYSSTWKKLNPDLASLKTSTVGVEIGDSLLWCAPAGCSCYDNYVVYNKADRNFINWGIRPANIETYVKLYSADGIKMNGNDLADLAMTAYSSKRDNITVEQVVTELAKDYLGMTWEQFQSIGRIEK